MDNDVLAHASSLVGVITPFIVTFLKARVIKVSDLGAHFLSLVVAGVAVAFAMLSLHAPLTYGSVGANIGIAFTLSQTVFQLLRGNPS